MTDQRPGPSPPDVPSPVRALRVLRERWWLVVAAGLVCMLGALAYSLSRPDEYSASSRILFEGSTLVQQIGGASATPDVNPEITQATNILLVTTRPVADIVRQTLKLDNSTDDLLAKIKVEADSSSNVVDLTITDEDPAQAALIANTWADRFVVYRLARARAEVRRGQTIIRQRIAALSPSAKADRTLLQSSLAKLIQVEALQTGDVSVVDRPSVPSSPTAPTPMRDGLIALFLGLVIGVGLAFLLNVLDRRAKTVEDIEGLFALRALASIPRSAHDPSGEHAPQAELEPFRILRDSIGSLALEREVHVILVTSAAPGEGKSTVALGLARAYALSGLQTVLVEADMRHPRFHQRFNLNGDSRGLTNALVGSVPVTALTRPMLPGRTLSIMPAGPTPPNSAELLRSQMPDVLRQLRHEAEIVILDAPPLLAVADTHVLLDNADVDTVLMVARVYHTTRDQTRRSRMVLDRHADRTFGLVVNAVR